MGGKGLEGFIMGNEHILVVEDVLLVRNQLRARLKETGYKVSVASKVSDALHLVRTEMPDLVVLDLTLPEEDPFASLTDGFAFLRLLRSTYAQADAAVIIYSANRTPDVEARAMSMGVSAVIEKKQGLTALITAIRSALDERRPKDSVVTPE
ncbi:MAG TPA: response regulator [Candidatus Acidoferrum sp.]|nr:response regulator [Candidatus Acidoferrum sp.]